LNAGTENELRDVFALQAMLSFSLTDEDVHRLVRGQSPQHDIASKFCYDWAEAMLAERRKRLGKSQEAD